MRTDSLIQMQAFKRFLWQMLLVGAGIATAAWVLTLIFPAFSRAILASAALVGLAALGFLFGRHGGSGWFLLLMAVAIGLGRYRGERPLWEQLSTLMLVAASLGVGWALSRMLRSGAPD